MRRKVGMVVCLLAFMTLVACGGMQDTAQEQGTESSDGAIGESHNLIISHFLPGNHPIQTVIFEEFGSELESQTDGRITYELYDSNILGAAGSQYDMAVTGEVSIALSVYGYTPGRFPLVSILELPFLAESAEHGSSIMMQLYEEFQEVQAEHEEIHPLSLFTAEPAQILSKNHRIETPEDLQGLRVRSPSPLANSILEALGAIPVSMPMGEVYEALERGAIDAAMAPLETLYNYSFHEVVDYITVGNFSATPFFSVMNLEFYNSLSESDKEIVNSLSGATMAKKAGSVFDVDGEKGRELSSESGAEFIELTEEQLIPWEEALGTIAQTWIEDMEANGYPGQEIYDRALELKNQ